MLSTWLMRSILVPAILALGTPAFTAALAPRVPEPPPRATPSPAPALDFATFATKVQPLFLAKREGLMSCVTCHDGKVGTRLQLDPLPEGAATWSEEAARKNFKAASSLVVPGSPTTSRLLLHPLDREAGGDSFHGGGKHWRSQSDPEWQVLSAWVRGGRGSSYGSCGAFGRADCARDRAFSTAVLSAMK